MIKIVIVDDHQLFLDGLLSVLSVQSDMQVLFAENSAKKAVRKIADNVPDIVITDISMPEMNGIEFIKVLRKNYPEIKILVLSMFANLQSLDGIDGYLLKESKMDDLLKAIKGIVLNDNKYFGGMQDKTDDFEFNKNILSTREKELIRLIAAEYTAEEIAEKMFISRHTVDSHRKNIFLKLQVKNTAGLIKKAIYLGVLQQL